MAENVFGVHAVDASGRVTVRMRLVRNRLLKFLGKLPLCLVWAWKPAVLHTAGLAKSSGWVIGEKLLSPRLATQLELDGEVIPETNRVPSPDGGV